MEFRSNHWTLHVQNHSLSCVYRIHVINFILIEKIGHCSQHHSFRWEPRIPEKNNYLSNGATQQFFWQRNQEILLSLCWFIPAKNYVVSPCLNQCSCTDSQSRMQLKMFHFGKRQYKLNYLGIKWYRTLGFYVLANPTTDSVDLNSNYWMSVFDCFLQITWIIFVLILQSMKPHKVKWNG